MYAAGTFVGSRAEARRQWVEYVYVPVGEVLAIADTQWRRRPYKRERDNLTPAFEAGKDEVFVFSNGTADGPSKLIASKIFMGGSKEIPRIEYAVSQELESFAVILVGPALGGDVHQPGVSALIGQEEAFLDFELVHSRDRDAQRQLAIARASRRDAVNKVAGLTTHVAADQDRAAGMTHLPGNVRVADARIGPSSQESKLQEVASVKRKTCYPGRIDHCSDGI